MKSRQPPLRREHSFSCLIVPYSLSNRPNRAREGDQRWIDPATLLSTSILKTFTIRIQHSSM